MKAKCMLILIVTTLCTVSVAFTLSPIPLTRSEKEWIRGGACKDCVEEWVGQSDHLGGKTECGHGPEADPTDCITDPNDNCYGLDCSEYGDPNHPCYDADCECFECGNVTTCEEKIEYWKAWCGGDSNETTASSYCDCETEDANDGPNYRWKNQTVIGGGNCSDYDPNLVTIHYCGMSGGAMLACATSSCQETGDWTTYEGSRKKCK